MTDTETGADGIARPVAKPFVVTGPGGAYVAWAVPTGAIPMTYEQRLTLEQNALGREQKK